MRTPGQVADGAMARDCGDRVSVDAETVLEFWAGSVYRYSRTLPLAECPRVRMTRDEAVAVLAGLDASFGDGYADRVFTLAGVV